jgi:RNA polymerase sigma-70 factor (ECF subfamily)
MFDLHTIQHLKKGEPEAFKNLFRLLYPRMKGYCKLFISNDSEVEDIIQESFIALWEKRKSIDPEKSIESFLFVILRNRCLNVLKANKMEQGRIDVEDLKVAELQYLYQLDFSGAEEKSLEEMLVESLKEAVDQLPPKMKKVFVLCKLEGKNQKEVANELEISLKMVEKHIAKAKHQIREKLLKEYPMLAVLIVMILK